MVFFCTFWSKQEGEYSHRVDTMMEMTMMMMIAKSTTRPQFIFWQLTIKKNINGVFPEPATGG